MKFSSLLLTTIVSSLFLTANIVASAESTTVEPVVVTATRFAASVDTAPVNITTITADDIVQSGATDLAQVLNYQGGVNISNLFGISGSSAKVDLGGFGENGGQNTLVLINGRRLNDVDLDGVNLTGIPLDAIARIEIIRGNATVLYGDNAVNGIINIITKNAFDGEQASVKLLAGSFQTQRLSIALRQRYDDTAFSLSIDGLQSNGYRDNNDYENFSLVSEINREELNWNYGARLNLSREKTGLPGPVDEVTFDTAPTTASSQDKAQEQRNSLEGFLESEHFISELTVSKKHQEYISTDFGLFETEADLNTISLTPRFRHQYGQHSLVTGFDFYNSTLDTKASPSEGRQDIKRNSYAIYATDTIAINQHTHINFGLRKQQVKVDIDNIDPSSSTNNSDDRSDNLTSWDITLSRQHHYGARNYVRLAKSFRFAVLDEMFIYPAPAYSPVINLLDPQTGRHIEIGTRQTFTNGLQLDANLFRINLEDEIAFDLATYNNVNLNKTRHDGLNINLRAPITKQFTLQAGYSWRKARFRAGPNKGNDIPLVPRTKMTLSGQYQLDNKRQLGLNTVYTSRRYFANDDANAGKKLAGYTRVDLSYTHQFSGWKGRILAQNISNNQVADFALYRSGSYYYYPLPERAIFFTFEGEL